MHRSQVCVHRSFSLPAYTQVTNFCYILGGRNGGQLIRGTAYMRVYTVGSVSFVQTETTVICRYNSYRPERYCRQASKLASFSSHLFNAVSSSLVVFASTAAPFSTSSRTMSTLLQDAAQ